MCTPAARYPTGEFIARLGKRIVLRNISLHYLIQYLQFISFILYFIGFIELSPSVYWRIPEPDWPSYGSLLKDLPSTFSRDMVWRELSAVGLVLE